MAQISISKINKNSVIIVLFLIFIYMLFSYLNSKNLPNFFLHGNIKIMHFYMPIGYHLLYFIYIVFTQLICFLICLFICLYDKTFFSNKLFIYFLKFIIILNFLFSTYIIFHFKTFIPFGVIGIIDSFLFTQIITSINFIPLLIIYFLKSLKN